MRDRIVRYLESVDKALPAETILRNVLKIQSPNSLTAEKLLHSILGRNAPVRRTRDGLWQLARSSDATDRAALAPIAALFIQSAREPTGRRVVGGALHDPEARSTVSFSLDSILSAEQRRRVRHALAHIRKHLLLVWRPTELREFNWLLRYARIEPWKGRTLFLQSLAALVFPDITSRFDPGRMAEKLGLPVPDGETPDRMAIYFARCIQDLLLLVPAEHRRNTAALEEWIATSSPKIDYTRYAFGPSLLREIPESSGIYLMRNRAGDLLYVGKARNLRRRVRSYFNAGALRKPKIAEIHHQLHSLEFVQTPSEIDALLLEMRMIRDFRPPINLQSEVHERTALYGTPSNFILLVPDPLNRKARAFLFRDHLWVSEHSLDLGKNTPKRFRDRVRSVYAAESEARPTTPEMWEKEIVARWFKANRRRLNYVDVEEAGDLKALMRILSSYLKDPDLLSQKVLYR